MEGLGRARENRFMALLLLVFAAAAAKAAFSYARAPAGDAADFFGIWSWARFLATQDLSGLYDIPTMHRFQAALDPFYTDSYYPFLYPPTYLLAIGPLGWLPQGVARVVWSVVIAGLFAAAVSAPGRRLLSLGLAVLAPTTVLCLIAGQNGLLTAAIMVGGLRLCAARPAIGGAVLGLLGYKPHFAVLVPVVLVAWRQWRALGAFGASAAAVAGLAAWWFGPGLWLQWWTTRGESWELISPFIAAKADLIPTVSAALRELGAGSAAVTTGQCAAGLAAAGLLWATWRAAPGSGRALAAVPVATLLVTPYAFLYDLPIVAGGMLLMWERSWADERPLASRELALGVIGLALPLLMLSMGPTGLPIAAPLLLAVLICLAMPFGPATLSPDWRGRHPLAAGAR